MGLQIANATATVYPVLQNANSENVSENPSTGASAIVRVYFEESTPYEALIAYGVQLRQPAFVQCDLADGVNFASQSLVRIEIDGGSGAYREYVCQGDPENHTVPGFSDADHTDVILELLQYAELGD